MTASQPDLLDLLAAVHEERDAGIAKVEDATDQWQRSVVDQAIREVAARGRRFSANDCRPLFPPGIRPALLGARFLAAAKSGLIVKVGYTPSTEKSTHAHPVAEWLAVAVATEGNAA